MSLRLVTCLLVLLSVAACSSYTSRSDSPSTHIVRKGETLFSIAWRYGKKTEDLARWNGLGDGTLIHPGQRLRLYGPAASASTATRSPASAPTPSRPLPEIPAQPAPEWAWPTTGEISVKFGDKPGTGTGVLIDGKTGQAIRAAAPGSVVYAGTGLIGYGQLVILKHNETYLSAYGYNASLLVKEGDSVRRGQKIGTMGEGPERKARLHFEIRRNGKPVDPQGFLTPR